MILDAYNILRRLRMNGTEASLPGIGVKPEWDQWAYDAFLEAGACNAVK